MPLDNDAFLTTQVVSPLAMLYKREAETPNVHFMTQPYADSERTFTWAQTMELARKLAARINTYRYPKGTRIGILGKNTAEWIITDIAIMLSGHISVPIFSTAGKETISFVLEHAECPMLFIGKLDNNKAVKEATSDELVTVGFPYPSVEAKVSWDEFTDIAPLDKSPLPD
jgi:long-chain acyl-CoA synthetase